ncbi:uncharacterized protein LOC110430575 [Sorghum bicolor]|uniref:uncharacterized protein LOC110430575 n=1 Tax=Sorghum bicolor TaxID=4558 RepID=UPI000B4266F5|nr:uncharacterized protein LOC110430575 [Sorghum bicolor]XP_021304045.1 uncharacterized protein LOC110430575 [Sorghum bicolor]|eukprot:XP_021304044.1 uncharacterized protein LOC110430575 [Sorghum bicolor]
MCCCLRLPVLAYSSVPDPYTDVFISLSSPIASHNYIRPPITRSSCTMDRFKYSNLTIIEEDHYIRSRMNQLQQIIIARLPHHGSWNITPQTIRTAIQSQFGASIAIDDISQFHGGMLQPTPRRRGNLKTSLHRY